MGGRARLTGKCGEFQQIEISANTADGHDKNLSIICFENMRQFL